MNTRQATLQFDLYHDEIVEWVGVWVFLLLGCAIILPYVAASEQPSFGWLSRCFTLSVLMGILMAAVQRLVSQASQLYCASQICISATVVAAFFAPFFQHLDTAPIYFKAEQHLPPVFLLFVLVTSGYALQWSIHRAKSRTSPVRATEKTPDENTIKTSSADICHIDQQFGSLRIHSLQGIEIWQIPFTTMLEIFSYIPGMRVHHSHWVADHAVEEFENNRILGPILKMNNGSMIPVGDTYLKKAKERYASSKSKFLKVPNIRKPQLSGQKSQAVSKEEPLS